MPGRPPAEREQQLERRRLELTEASRRRQALEKLKERRAAEHRVEAARRESALLDEVALNRHLRKGAA